MLLGKNILLRAVEPNDIDVLYQWENDMEIWHVSNTITPFSRHILNQYVNSVQDIYSEKQLRLIIDKLPSQADIVQRAKPIGAIDLFDFDPQHCRAGVGILIAEKEERGNGYASEALDLLIHYAFNTLCLHQLYCNIPSDNKASLELFRKHNFQIAGNKKEWIKDRNNWVDEYLLQLIFQH